MSADDRQRRLEIVSRAIKSIPDYPKKGVLFRDISSMCQDPEAFGICIDLMAEAFSGDRIQKVVCAEARGFVFGAPLAYRLKAGLVLVRKPGKLPRETISQDYELEYGMSTLQLHKDAIAPGERVLLVDDLVATGGTIEAMITLVRKLQGEIVKAAFVIDLEDLGGIRRIRQNCGVESFALLKFPGH